jgi:Ca2+-transporting ATPase
MSTVGRDKRLNYYRMSASAVIAELRSHRHGLTSPEARRRRDQHGANTLIRPRQRGSGLGALRELKNLFVLPLLISAAAAWYIGEAHTAAILLAIAGVTIIAAYFRERQPHNLFTGLAQRAEPRTKVMRSGQVKVIDSSELVLGDVVHVESGEVIPADLRLLEVDDFCTADDELTGGTPYARKFTHALRAVAPLAERHNLAFMGTRVVSGNATGIVVGIGMHTELGRVAGLTAAAPSDSSPLQNELDDFAKRLAQITLVLVALLGLIAWQAGLSFTTILLFAISIVLALIPNGLVPGVNMILDWAARQFSVGRAVVKRLSATETLGAADILLLDAVGTLTEGTPTVQRLVVGKLPYTTSGLGYGAGGSILGRTGKPLGKKVLSEAALFFQAAALTSSADITLVAEAGHEPAWQAQGAPEDAALEILARKAGIHIKTLERDHPVVMNFAYDSERGVGSTVRRVGEQIIVFVRGEPEAVMQRSTHLWDHGHVRKLLAGDRAFYTEHLAPAAATSHVGLAYRIFDKPPTLRELTMANLEQKLTFLGIATVSDPLRATAVASLVAAEHAGVRIAVATEQAPPLARLLAVEAKLADTPDAATVVTGDELAQLHDSQLLELLMASRLVLSQISGEDRLRIVEIARRSGQVVALTGNCLTDIPALRRADVGIALSASPELVRDASDIALWNDSVDTILDGARSGRRAFRNIARGARATLTDNAAEILLVLISLGFNIALDIPIAITAIQIIAIDVLIQLFPITALAWDTSREQVMRAGPRRLKDHIANKQSFREFAGFGLLAALLAYGNFVLFFERAGVSAHYIDIHSPIYFRASTLACLTLVLCQVISLLLIRTEHHQPFFTRDMFANKKLLLAFAISALCLVNIIYNPALQLFLGTHDLTLNDWAAALIAAAIYLAIRLSWRSRHKHHHVILNLQRELSRAGFPTKI